MKKQSREKKKEMEPEVGCNGIAVAIEGLRLVASQQWRRHGDEQGKEERQCFKGFIEFLTRGNMAVELKTVIRFTKIKNKKTAIGLELIFKSVFT